MEEGLRMEMVNLINSMIRVRDKQRSAFEESQSELNKMIENSKKVLQSEVGPMVPETKESDKVIQDSNKIQQSEVGPKGSQTKDPEEISKPPKKRLRADYSHTTEKQIEKHEISKLREGQWRRIKVESDDKVLELSAQVHYASIDQVSKGVGGSYACSVLATKIAGWLHEHINLLPDKETLDGLIRQGSQEWEELRKVRPEYIKDFWTGEFDLDTVLKEKVSPVSGEVTYASFHVENTVEYAIDNRWEEITSDVREPRIYIVRYAQHFFCSKG
ncbi:hypothetical protein SUGI_0542390 [Cryptomeria japonica]|nr:hypothetical protein SUGI_0542390 [Cryptomeria japonica]